MMGQWLRGVMWVGMGLGLGLSLVAQTQSLPAAPSAVGQSAPGGQSLPAAPGAGSGSLPSAPGAALPSGTAKPLLVVPPVTYTVPDRGAPAAGKSAGQAAELCYGPREGIYATLGPPTPAELKGQMQNYMDLVSREVFDDWLRHMTRAQKDAWAKTRVVAVRFAVMSDGSLREPEVTVSSGKVDTDQHALDAVKAHTVFPAPPKGYARPVMFCLRFGYNTYSEDMDPGRRDRWQETAKPQP